MQPVAGDPAYVATQASDIQTAAENIQSATSGLRSLVYGDTRSSAVDAMKRNIEQLAGVLTEAHVRYAAAGQALQDFAPVLQQAQEDVNNAISAHGATDVNGARWQEAEALAVAEAANANPFASDQSRQDAMAALQQAQARMQQETQAAQAAETAYESALNNLETAARRAADQIQLGVEASKLNDTFRDQIASIESKLHKALSGLLAKLHELLSEISSILAIVSVVLEVVGLIVSLAGAPEVGGFIFAAGKITGEASALAAAADLAVQAMRFAIGDISFGDLMSDAIWFGVGLLAGSGGGKLAGKAAGALMKNSKGTIETIETTVKGSEEIGESSTGLGVGIVQDKTHDSNDDHDFLSNLIDPKHQTAPEMLPFLRTRSDVDQLTPDFSKIDVNQIIAESGGAEVSSSPSTATYCSVGAA